MHLRKHGTKNIFENPIEYKKNSNLQYLFAHAVIENTEINSFDRILDVGCGDGRITAEIADMVPEGQVIGVDISIKMIESASKDHVRNNLGFMVMDAEKNIFRQQFDKIFSFCCLHWIKGEGQLRALIGIKNALTPNGKAVLLVPLKNKLDMLIDTIVSNEPWAQYFKEFISPRAYFTKEEYSALLESSGLEKQVFQEKVMSYEFPARRDMELFLGACLPHMKTLPSEMHDKFLSDIVTAFIERILKNERIIFSIPMLEVQAVKKTLSLENTNTTSPLESAPHESQSWSWKKKALAAGVGLASLYVVYSIFNRGKIASSTDIQELGTSLKI